MLSGLRRLGSQLVGETLGDRGYLLSKSASVRKDAPFVRTACDAIGGGCVNLLIAGRRLLCGIGYCSGDNRHYRVLTFLIVQVFYAEQHLVLLQTELG